MTNIYISVFNLNMHETYVMHRKLNKERSIIFYISWYTYVHLR
jgi:hypothetical protein